MNIQAVQYAMIKHAALVGKADIQVHPEDELGNIVTLMKGIRGKWNGLNYRVPKGFESDGVSTPSYLWPIISPPVDPKTIRAGIVHDWIYRHQPKKWSREDADNLFAEMCREDGLSSLQTTLAFAGLRMFGDKAWQENAERKAKMLAERKAARMAKRLAQKSKEGQLAKAAAAGQTFEQQYKELYDQWGKIPDDDWFYEFDIIQNRERAAKAQNPKATGSEPLGTLIPTESIGNAVAKVKKDFGPLAKEVSRIFDTKAHEKEVIRQIAEDRRRRVAEAMPRISEAINNFEDRQVRAAVDAGRMNNIVGESARMKAILYAREKDARRNAALSNLWRYRHGADSLPPYRIQDKARTSTSHHGGDTTWDRTSSPAAKQKQMIEGKQQSKSV